MNKFDKIIKLKDLTEIEKSVVRENLIKLYLKLIDDVFTDSADYVQIDSLDYWKDYIPISKPIISASNFIKIFDNSLSNNSKHE